MNFDTPNLVDEENDFYLENEDMEHEDFVMF